MNSAGGGKPRLLQPTIQKIASTLRAGKHNARVVLTELLLQDGDATVKLFLLLEYFDGLRNRLVRREFIAAATDLNVNRLRREGVCNILHRFRPRCGEHHRLTRRRAELKNLFNLRLKSHVQHSIRLVEDDVRRLHRAHGRGESRGRFKKIVQSPGRGDDDVGARTQRAQLIALGGAAVEHRRAAPRGWAKFRALVVDLNRQLPRGR